MKSPFPGMDPFLEAYWRDVHHALCTYSRDVLNESLSSNYSAMIDERLIVESSDGNRSISPDVRVVQHRDVSPDAIAVATVDATEPLVVTLSDDEMRQAFIEIKDRSGTVVTVIEFLSPSNKLPGDGSDKYKQKQFETRRSGINLVEIDLTRTGRWQLLCALDRIPKRARTTYMGCVWRSATPAKFEIYPATMAQPLPSIAIPLLPADADVVLPLQPLLDRAYKNGRYGMLIDYTKPCDPPFNEFEQPLVQQLLTSAGLIKTG